MPAPASRPSNARLFVLIGAGVVGSGLLLLVVSKLDTTGARTEKPRISGATDILTPGALSESERRANAEKFSKAQLEDGAWVQVADEKGRLSQQYSARSLKPLPDGEMALEAPKAMLFQPDGRVIVLSADSGRARVPRQALESGTMTGNVTIRVFRPVMEAEAMRAVNVDRDEPVIEVRASDAHFDNSEVSCRGEVHLVSEMGTFDGQGLSMILDQTSGELKSLIIDKCTKPIVFVRGADGKTRPEGARTAAAGPAATAPATPTTPPAPSETPKPAKQATPAKPAAPAKNAKPSADAPRFFRLELEDEVLVTRLRDGGTTTLRGDLLRVIFAMESDAGFAEVASVPAAAPAFAPTLVMTPEASGSARPAGAIAAAVFAQPGSAEPSFLQAPPAANETITISYAGRLILKPADKPLKSADDIDVELRCDPGKIVQLDDSRSRAHVECDRVAFRTDAGESGDLVEAFGSASRPLTLTSPRLKASGQTFRLQQSKGIGGFEGPGIVQLAAGGERFAELFGEGAFDDATAVVSRDANGAVIIEAWREAAASVAPSTVDIAWKEKLDLVFARDGARDGAQNASRGGAPTDTGSLRSAEFVGEVMATGESFTLNADRLSAGFAGSSTTQGSLDSGQLERIVAHGSEAAPARAARRDGKGSLTAGSLDLALRLRTDGATAPATLVATKAVEARNPSQTLWTSALTVRFLDGPAGGNQPTNQAGVDATTANEMAAEIAAVEGRDGVQARLEKSPVATGQGSGGASTDATNEAGRAIPVRVWADTLDGDGVGRSLSVAGEDVWVVRDVIVADRLKGIRFDEATRVATAAGLGRVRAFAQSVAPQGTGLAPRPTLPERPALNVEWNDGFRFDEGAASGGALELNGSVRVRSTPDRSATDAVDAQWLRLELDRDAAATTLGAATAEAKSGIRRIIATGTDAAPAVFASRRWADETRNADPRLMQLEGPAIEYDLQTREGSVVGAGKLLVHVPDANRDQAPTVPDVAPAANETALAGRPIGVGTTGTTRFTWLSRLDLTRAESQIAQESPNRFRVTMRDGVQMVHSDRPGIDAPMVLTAATLEADFERLDGAAGASANPKDGDDGVNLTGTAKLLAVHASGDAGTRVHVDTGEYQIECEHFRYDVLTQIATLTGDNGRLIVVVGVNPPGRRTAESVEWNVQTGTIRIKNARGG